MFLAVRFAAKFAERGHGRIATFGAQCFGSRHCPVEEKAQQMQHQPQQMSQRPNVAFDGFGGVLKNHLKLKVSTGEGGPETTLRTKIRHHLSGNLRPKTTVLKPATQISTKKLATIGRGLCPRTPAGGDPRTPRFFCVLTVKMAPNKYPPIFEKSAKNDTSRDPL